MEISQQTREFIRNHRTDDVRDLALHAKRTPDLDLPWALDQIAGWQTARSKLPRWADTDGIIYPPHLSMEQCSSEPTARYKAELAARLMASDGAPAQSDATAHAQSEQSDEPTVPTTTTDTAAPAPRRGRLIDLTGGFGVDFSTMARDFAQAVYVERQPDLCAIARHNLDLLGLGDAQVVNADAASFLATAEDADIIVIDPARRDEHGGRTFAIADCTPDILGMLDLLTAKAGHVLVKLSPMLDWHKAVEDCRGTVREVHIVAVANECKELLLVLRGQPDAVPVEDVTVTVHCVNITARGTERFTVMADAAGVHAVGTARHPDDAATCAANAESVNANAVCTDSTDGEPVAEGGPTGNAVGNPGNHADDGLPFRYLYEPNAAMMKAGCFAALSSAFGVPQLATNSHLFVSDTPVEGFPGRAFRVATVMTMGKKDLKRGLSGLTHANIATRNFPMSVSQLRGRLKLQDGGDAYLFATTDRDDRRIIIRATHL
ncbi:RsmD family RNA methyltransferase [Bifidobacterium saeculare]|uniref:RsmD family RNA methyltransferase n=1 Tax=Bifidobacterium pullorum subsp. gallinarum TaxID=78344 RepID=A0A921LUX4_9BIFI|nr:class I SAM-dependent methyltransferase [Bifidobacterium pullorum]MBE5065411.1 RsmD family RNA methyltransferase [Bifidobacterium pullorum subsp. saeculare]HJG41417.1 RsmD family RNA methyltransferase [Bifidobacterium pullorum subsp. gallinarum]